jgi:hypothetical protein
MGELESVSLPFTDADCTAAACGDGAKASGEEPLRGAPHDDLVTVG